MIMEEEYAEKTFLSMQSNISEDNQAVIATDEEKIVMQSTENRYIMSQQGRQEGNTRRLMTDENVNIELSDESNQFEKFPLHAGSMQLT